MPSAHQRNTVVHALLEEPYRFQFCQAVRLILEWLSEHGVGTEKALTDHLVFENDLSLSFAPAQIAALSFGTDQQPRTEQGLAQALADDTGLQIHLTPAFMGFLGINGTLPFHYTETIQGHISQTRDAAPRAFLDMFSNRVLVQFYMAWCKHRVEQPDSRDVGGFLSLLLHFIGLQPDSNKNEAATVANDRLAQYAGVLLQRPVPLSVLARLLSDYLGVPLEIHESTGTWITLLEHEQCALGGENTLLSSNTLLGERSWRPDLLAQISIGPLSKDEFHASLPDGSSARVLEQLLGMLANPTVSYEVRLILKAEEIHPLCLFGDDTYTARLGQDSFLVSETESQDRGDVSYFITLLPPLPPLPARGDGPVACVPAQSVGESGHHQSMRQYADRLPNQMAGTPANVHC